MEYPLFKRMSIAIGAGKVLAINQSAENLSKALDEELDFYQRCARIPAEIIISREDGV